MSSAGHLPKALRQALESLARAGVLQLPRVDVSATATDGLRLSEPPVAMDRGTVTDTLAASGSAGTTVLNQTSDPETDPRDAHDQEAEGSNMATRGKKSSSAAGDSKKAAESNAASSSQTPSPARRSAKLKRELLAKLCDEVSSCTRCPALVANRTQTVFGVGNVQTRLCFFGEAPGADEDRKGEPFVGRAGQLLDRIIEACRLKREDVYILNTIKCRPPDNRTPTPEEMDNCRPYFEQQLDILRPEYICCLGRTAAVAMFGPQITLSQLRGRILTWNGVRVVVTYHPAYLLRNPAAKKDTWEDMKLLMRDMGIEIPANHTN